MIQHAALYVEDNRGKWGVVCACGWSTVRPYIYRSQVEDIFRRHTQRRRSANAND